MTIARDIQKSIKASEMKRTQKKRTLIMNHMNNVKRKRGRLLHDVMCKTIGKRKKKKQKKTKEEKKRRKKKNRDVSENTLIQSNSLRSCTKSINTLFLDG